MFLPLVAVAIDTSPHTVHKFYGPMVTGVGVSKTGRVFVNFPRWGDPVVNSVVEIKDGREVPYPNATWNRPGKGPNRFVCVQSVVVDPKDRLWVVDAAAPMLADTLPGAPKLVCVDLGTNRVQRVYHFPESVAHATTYLNDVRFDLTRGKRGYAFLTDSGAKGPNGIIVLDLASGQSWRRLNDAPSTKAEPGYVPVVEGQKLMMRTRYGHPEPAKLGSDGIAIVPSQDRLYFCPLTSPRLYSVPISMLIDRTRKEEDVASAVVDEGIKGPSDGMVASANGTLFVTDYVRHQVKRRELDGSYEPVIQLAPYEWPDTLSIGPDGFLYVTANQLQRQKAYQIVDKRRKPYRLVRARVGAMAQ